MKIDKKLLLILGIIALVYLIIIIVYPKETFWVVDGGAKLIFAKSIINNGFRSITLNYPGRVFDPYLVDNPISVRFMRIKEGEIYSVYPLWFPLFSAILFQIFGYFGLYIIPFLSGLGIIYFSYLLSKELVPKLAYLSLLFVGNIHGQLCWL